MEDMYYMLVGLPSTSGIMSICLFDTQESAGGRWSAGTV